MKASELIEKLKEIIKEEGDLTVVKTGVIGGENYEGDIDADCIQVSYLNVVNGKFVRFKRIEL